MECFLKNLMFEHLEFLFWNLAVSYGLMSNIEMIELLEVDKRLEKPDGTPDFIYDLMFAKNHKIFQILCK